jgi:hypothetical protein
LRLQVGHALLEVPEVFDARLGMVSFGMARHTMSPKAHL